MVDCATIRFPRPQKLCASPSIINSSYSQLKYDQILYASVSDTTHLFLRSGGVVITSHMASLIAAVVICRDRFTIRGLGLVDFWMFFLMQTVPCTILASPHYAVILGWSISAAQ
jgi:hypothetical protein